MIKNKLLVGFCIFTLGAITQKLVSKLLKKRKTVDKKSLCDLVGNTPIIYLKSLSKLCNCEIYAKAEFLNPTGSMKDRAALGMIQAAIKSNKLGPHQPWIFEGTTGSTGISLAAIGNSLGLKTCVYLPDDLAQEKYAQLELLNAKLIKVRPVSIANENHFCRLAQKDAAQCNAFYCDQFNNLDNGEIHYNTTGVEIIKQMNRKVDCFVMSAGTGGTIQGVSRRFKEEIPNVKIILADPPGSAYRNLVKHKVCYSFVEAEGQRQRHPFDTIIEGVGQNRQTKNFEQALIDDAFTITDQESLHMARFLIQNEGLCVGSSSAMNCVAVVKAARKYPHLKIFVTVLCDTGSRYQSKFYSRDYLDKNKIKFEPLESYDKINFVL